MRLFVGLALSAGVFLQACGGDPCAAGKSVFTGQAHPDCNTSTAAGGAPGGVAGGTGSVLASGVGNGTLTVPAGVSAVQVTANTSATVDNFTVTIAGRLTVNEVLDTETPGFSGSYPVATGTPIAVATDPQTSWSITATNLGSVTQGLFAAAGSGDQAFTLPARTSSYRIQGLHTGPSQNFIVLLDGRTVVNVILGRLENRTQYINTFTLTGGTLSVTSSTGVAWSIDELPP